MLDIYTPYSTASPYYGAAPGWIPDVIDQQRIQAYSFYEQMYWNVPQVFSVTQREDETDPVYLPNARTIIETCHRYLMVGCTWRVDPAVGVPADQALVHAAISQLWAREKMAAKLNMQKRFGLIRGDAIWHVVADPNKPLGSRISIYDIDPAAYFPIEDPDLPGRVIGCHLVTQQEDPEAKKTYIRRRTYRKTLTGTVTTELNLFETGGWDDRLFGQDKLLKLVQVLQPVTELPPAITSLPVYHVRNFGQPEDLFGSSELRGFERIIAGVSQTASDEELTLAIQGLGLYVTNSGPPINEVTGKEENWKIGPRRVLELDAGGAGDQATFFNKVAGAGSVDPMIQHMQFLQNAVYEASATPAIARGNIQVTVAESGVALALELSPLLSKNREKEDEQIPVLNQMLYDLVQKWLPSFEGLPAGINVSVEMITQDPMPLNRDAKIKEIISLATSVPPIISAAHARLELSALGYEFPPEIGADIVQEQEDLAVARQADPYQRRVDEELAREQTAT